MNLIISNPPPSEDAENDDNADNIGQTGEEGEELEAPEPELSTSELFDITAQVTNEFQVGDISSALGVEVASLVVEEPPLPPESPEWKDQQEQQYNDILVSHGVTNRTVLK